jgi:hypothetical protein
MIITANLSASRPTNYKFQSLQLAPCFTPTQSWCYSGPRFTLLELSRHFHWLGARTAGSCWGFGDDIPCALRVCSTKCRSEHSRSQARQCTLRARGCGWRGVWAGHLSPASAARSWTSIACPSAEWPLARCPTLGSLPQQRWHGLWSLDHVHMHSVQLSRLNNPRALQSLFPYSGMMFLGQSGLQKFLLISLSQWVFFTLKTDRRYVSWEE